MPVKRRKTRVPVRGTSRRSLQCIVTSFDILHGSRRLVVHLLLDELLNTSHKVNPQSKELSLLLQEDRSNLKRWKLRKVSRPVEVLQVALSVGHHVFEMLGEVERTVEVVDGNEGVSRSERSSHGSKTTVVEGFLPFEDDGHDELLHSPELLGDIVRADAVLKGENEEVRV